MKPSNLMQGHADKTYNNTALNSARLEVNGKKSINPWLALAFLSAISIGVMLAVGIPENIKQAYSKSSQGSQEQKAIVTPRFMEAFVWTTKLKLEDLKLNHRLQVTTNDANDVVINGNISKQEASNWQAFLGWYESKDGFPVLTHNVNTNATSGNIPELKSVWFDTKPTVYFTDGRSGNIGTSFEDGWKIINIEAWAVFVERNGNTVMLQY